MRYWRLVRGETPLLWVLTIIVQQELGETAPTTVDGSSPRVVVVGAFVIVIGSVGEVLAV